MDPGPSNWSSHSLTTKQLVCVCRQYCQGQPRLVSEATFYRHLAEAEEDEYHLLQATKASSVEAASMILSNRSLSNKGDGSPDESGPGPGPSNLRGICPSARHIATLQVLSKRAREDPDSQTRKHAGKRKCAQNNGDPPPNVGYVDILDETSRKLSTAP